MLRWNDVEEQKLFGLTVKMYREPYVAKETVTSVYKKLEMDHYAYKHLGSELLAYRIIDTNFVSYMEERGDIERLKTILIPIAEDTTHTVL
jgi:hypothetical protein